MTEVDDPHAIVLIREIVGGDILVLDTVLPQCPQDLSNFLTDFEWKVVGIVAEPLCKSRSTVFHLDIRPLVCIQDCR
jgi:hypothetical protein